MKKNDFVVKILTVRDTKTATVQKVSKVSKGVIHLQDSSITYSDKTLQEIDPPMASMGIYSELVHFDGGEVEKLGLK